MTAANQAVSTATTGVDATTLAGSVAKIDFSMWGMFMQADWVVKSVMILLVLASFWCWAIIFEKYFLFRNIKAKAARFESDFWSSEALDKFYEKSKKRVNHPMAVIFVAAMEEWFRSKNVANQTPQGLRLSLRERIVQVMMVARNREVESLEKGLGFLATVGSAAPFIGLFGTVCRWWPSRRVSPRHCLPPLLVCSRPFQQSLLTTNFPANWRAFLTSLMISRPSSIRFSRVSWRLRSWLLSLVEMITAETEEAFANLLLPRSTSRRLSM